MATVESEQVGTWERLKDQETAELKARRVAAATNRPKDLTRITTGSGGGGDDHPMESASLPVSYFLWKGGAEQ
jgi:hypothetical protein